MFEQEQNIESQEHNLQTQITEVVTTKVFNDLSLSDILTTLYKNILEDREITKQTVKDISELIKGNGDGESYLKLKEIELLQDNNDQLLKISDLMKNLLVAKSQPKIQSIAGLLVSESERLALTSADEDQYNNAEFEEIKEDAKSNFSEIDKNNNEIIDGETNDEEESKEYDDLIMSIEKNEHNI